MYVSSTKVFGSKKAQKRTRWEFGGTYIHSMSAEKDKSECFRSLCDFMQMPNISPSICLSDFKKKKKWLKLCIASIFLYEKSVKKSISKKKRKAEEGLKKTFRRL